MPTVEGKGKQGMAHAEGRSRPGETANQLTERGLDSELRANTRSGGLQRAKLSTGHAGMLGQRPRGSHLNDQGPSSWW